MKIIIWLMILLLIQSKLESQPINNSNFEQWEFVNGIEEPIYWETNNKLNYISVSKDSSQTGNYAIKITGNAPGFEGPYRGTTEIQLEYQDNFLIRGISAKVKYKVNQKGRGGIGVGVYKDQDFFSKGFWGYTYLEKDTVVNWHPIEVTFPEPVSTQEIDSLYIFIFAGGIDEGFGIQGNSELIIDNIEFETNLCDCCYHLTTFCGSVSKNEKTIVSLLEILTIDSEKYNDEVIVARVIEDLTDNISPDTIRIFSSNGTSCISHFNFEEKDTVLMKLYEDYVIRSVNEEIEIEYIYRSPVCESYPYIKLENDTLEGELMPNLFNISYSTFKDNFQNCRLSPKYIKSSGRIATWQKPEKGQLIKELKINDFLIEYMDTNGNFEFPYMELDSASRIIPISPSSNGEIIKDVTISDITKIQKHILSAERFNTPWQLIAADVNNSG